MTLLVHVFLQKEIGYTVSVKIGMFLSSLVQKSTSPRYIDIELPVLKKMFYLYIMKGPPFITCIYIHLLVSVVGLCTLYLYPVESNSAMHKLFSTKVKVDCGCLVGLHTEISTASVTSLASLSI